MNEKADREKARQNALDRLQVLDTPEERAYDDLTRLAAHTCGTPIALISLSDTDRQWFKSRIGLQVTQIPREHGFCDNAIKSPNELTIVPDTLKDDRFAAHPLVTGEPRIRFYAGAPLLTMDSHAIGTICVIDTKPRELNADQLQTLQFLSRQVMVMLESKANLNAGRSES